MGYPLKHTLVYTLLRHLMDLQRNASVTRSEIRFGYRDVISILRHTLIADLLNGSEKDIINEITSSNLITVSSDKFADHLL